MVLVKPSYLKQVDWMKSPGKLLKKKKKKTVRNRKESRKEEIEREREGGKKERKWVKNLTVRLAVSYSKAR